MTTVSILEIPRDPAEQKRVRDTVGDRVEEGTTGRGCPGGFGHGTVENVRDGREEEQQGKEERIGKGGPYIEGRN